MANGPWPMAMVMVMVAFHGPMVNAHGGEEFSHVAPGGVNCSVYNGRYP